MCGLAGYITQQQISKENLLEKGKRMGETIARRGPDCCKTAVFEKEKYRAVFVHSRLSIIDLSTRANQPMEFKGHVILHTGEIYNYKELRSRLEHKGYEFTTNSDTEVLLKGYLHWSEELPALLYGVFAFVILNEESGDVFMARDQFGLRPLYYANQHRFFSFGSLVSTVKTAFQQPLSVNWKGIQQNFQFQSSVYPDTCLEEINILPPGCWLKKEIKKEPVIYNYYDLATTTSTADYTQNVVEQYDSLLKQAMERNAVADVPLGMLLSGGLDSSVLAKIAGEQQLKFSAFTLTGKNETETPNSEHLYAQRLANQSGFQHYLYSLSSREIINHIDELLSVFEEPVSFLEPHYFMGKYMQDKGIKVALSGLGPDEMLLGYHRHQQIKSYYQHSIFSRLSTLLPVVNHRFRKLKSLVSAKSIPAAFIALNEDIQDILFEDLFPDKNNYLMAVLPAVSNNLDDAQQLNLIEIITKISSHHALTADKYLMHFGVEGRYPYLDKDVVEFQFHSPEHLKWSGEGKELQRLLAAKYLPEEYLERNKTGFNSPWRAVITTPHFRELVLDEISSLRRKRIVNNDLVEELTSEGITEENWQILLYAASLNRWWENWL